jgi:hypothetical protein
VELRRREIEGRESAPGIIFLLAPSSEIFMVNPFPHIPDFLSYAFKTISQKFHETH